MWWIYYHMKFSISSLVSALDPYQPSSFAVGLDMGVWGWYQGRYGKHLVTISYYNYLCNQCLSPLTLWVRILLRRGVLDTTLCDKVCHWLAQVCGFLRVLRFPPPIKLTAIILPSPTKYVGLIQNRYYIIISLPWYIWKISRLTLNNNYSLKRHVYLLTVVPMS
jgi:hypothetical protein